MAGGVDFPPSSQPGPVRTCVGCRAKADPTQLLRLVVADDDPADKPVRIVPDAARRRPGRGASLHPTSECLELAVRRRAFARAFRLAGPFDVDEVRRFVEQQHKHK